jgi:hypothetical protein
MTATLPARTFKRDKSRAGRCPVCFRPTSSFAVTGGGPTFPRSEHTADGWRCSDHARTDGQRRRETKAALASIAEETLPFVAVME